MDKASEAASETTNSPSVGHAAAYYHSGVSNPSNVEYSLADDSSTNFGGEAPPAYHQLTIADGEISAEVMRT